MYLTILSGQVKPENWASLAHTFSRTINRYPKDLVQSFLLQDCETPLNWEIIEVWRSQEAYEKARATGHANPCVQLFCEKGVPPQKSHNTMIRCYTRV